MEGKDNYFDQEIGNKPIPKEGEAQAKILDQTKASETSDNSNDIDITTSLHEDPVAVFENPQDKLNFLKKNLYNPDTLGTIHSCFYEHYCLL